MSVLFALKKENEKTQKPWAKAKLRDKDTGTEDECYCLKAVSSLFLTKQLQDCLNKI